MEQLRTRKLPRGLVKDYPDALTADQAMFFRFHLLLDDQDGAMFQFDQLLRRYPEKFSDEVDYWTGMALYFRCHEAAQDHFLGYQDRFPAGGYLQNRRFVLRPRVLFGSRELLCCLRSLPKAASLMPCRQSLWPC